MGGFQEGTNLHLKEKARVESLRGSSRKSSGWIAQLCAGTLQGVQRSRNLLRFQSEQSSGGQSFQ
jgi:hypothetical protein